MTMLDDQLDDLLRSFRADEAFIDDEIRGRIWGEVVTTTTLAATPLPRRTDRRTRRARRVLALAAALLVAALTGGVVARATVDDPGTVTAGVATAPGTGTTVPVPTLNELADAAAARQGPVLGDPGATYAHIVASFVYHDPDDAAEGDMAGQLESWVAADGTGRLRGSRTDGGNPADETFDQPGTLQLGRAAPSIVLVLPDDPEEVIATMTEALDGGDLPAEKIAPALAELLAQPGLPAPARAGALRALDHIGFIVTDSTLDDTVTLTGPSGDGSTLTATLDLQTGQVVSQQVSEPDGRTTATWYSEVDLRPTTS